jgi:proprotein convertase subtilisin/kexin type 5
MTGYILSGTSCLTCSSLIPGCLDCLSGPLCLNCDSSQYMMAPVYPSANCFCITGYYFNGTNCQTCSSAMAGCLECSSGSICTNCILSMPLINDVCTCSVGYSIVNLTCV